MHFERSTGVIEIADRLRAGAVAALGARASEWLERLPALVDEYTRRWRLDLGAPFDADFAYVAPATRADGTRAVLKISVLDPESRDEPDALRFFDGNGAVRLFEFARHELANVMLLERCLPGTPLLDLPEDEANEIACEVLLRVARPAPSGHPFVLAANRARGWGEDLPEKWSRAGRPFERELVELAIALFAELASARRESLVVNQDHHHGNILSAQREPWLLIDPKPVVGELEYAAAALLRDRLEELVAEPDPRPRLYRRFEQLTRALRIDPERMRAWGVAMAVDFSLWDFTVRSTAYAEQEIAYARLLSSLD